jgi:hypothetical protein
MDTEDLQQALARLRTSLAGLEQSRERLADAMDRALATATLQLSELDRAFRRQ